MCIMSTTPTQYHSVDINCRMIVLQLIDSTICDEESNEILRSLLVQQEQNTHRLVFINH